jgi:hypothetical protein
MSQDEVAVALNKSSAWVRYRVRYVGDLPVYQGAKTGRGHRNLFLPTDVEALRQKLLPQLKQSSDTRDLLSVAEVACKLGLTRAYINRRIRHREIYAVDFSRPGSKRPLWKIPREEYEYVKQNGWRKPE